MSFFREFFEKSSRLLGFLLTYLYLCGIDRSPRQSNFTLKDLQATNLLQTMPPLSEIPTSFYILSSFLITAVFVVIFLIRYLHKKKLQEGLEKIAEDQAQLAVDAELESRQVEEEDRDFLSKLCSTSDPAKILPVLRSSEKFEQIVNDYKNSKKFDKIDLAKIYMLRKGLQFSFKNMKFGFICTQMLEPGTHLEFQIRHKKKNIVFMSTILDSNETQLLIKPPTVKRRPANLKQFSELYCMVRRGSEAEYEFKFKIIGQLVTDLNAVILRHTKDIKKLQIRISERLPMDMIMNFQFLTTEQFEIRKQNEQKKFQVKKFSGRIKDMGAGGLKVELKKLHQESISKGDFFLFHLPYASLRENLAASVVEVVSKESKSYIHLKFKDIDLLTHMKLNQYLHRKKISIQAA